MAKERKLHFGSEIWTYRVGVGNVVIRDPQRKSSLRRLLKFLDAVCAEIGLPADNYAKAFKA